MKVYMLEDHTAGGAITIYREDGWPQLSDKLKLILTSYEYNMTVEALEKFKTPPLDRGKVSVTGKCSIVYGAIFG